MKYTLALILTFVMILSGIGSVEASETAPPPSEEKIMEELDEHWTEEVLPDIYDQIFSHFESANTGVPTK
jgi:hypothetical protein